MKQESALADKWSARLRQRGMALVMSLVLLLAMTLLVLAAAQSTVLQERMAGGLQDQLRAFEAAESALREAEELLSGPVAPTFNNTNGLYLYDADQRPDWRRRNAGAASTGAIEYSGDIDGVLIRPQYFLEEMPPLQMPGSSLEAGVPDMELQLYTITVRGFGASPQTQVVLESTFRR
ncbi:hypothetical protein K8B33_09960 [Alcanivorax sp. JB21]|uniref:pilus assembly PilX family protein n=1 Tax=Alcanivorax limicola TaxID=2874102 RepID=UPI001CBC419E|nr:PilX N-terminal domain-containing pilus assembly protein [Alcanivorax limicola]MBZ2189421.1 hypothetical protein [Alcanivorax limicola]